jgi:hypothetical protein
MIYLASPYSHPDPAVRTYRFQAARAFTWHHHRLGSVIFSPIVYGHQFACDFQAPTDAASWAHFNESILEVASEVWVLRLSGWDQSIGIMREIEFAENFSIPVSEKDPLPYAPL